MYVFRFVSFDFFWLYILHVPFLESHLEIIMVCYENAKMTLLTNRTDARCVDRVKPADSFVGISFRFLFQISFRWVCQKKVCLYDLGKNASYMFLMWCETFFILRFPSSRWL